MFGRLLSFSLKNRLLVLLATTAIVAAGTTIAFRLPIDVFPDLTAPTVTVLTEAHGMAAEEVELLITFPIETMLNGATGVRRVRSSSSTGISIVWVEFDWDTDIFIARQIVNEKLQLAAASLPPQSDRPVLGPITSIMGEIMLISLQYDSTAASHTSAGSDARLHERPAASMETHVGIPETHVGISPSMQLRGISDGVIRRRLLAIPGVAQVIPIGGDVREYQVHVSPRQLAAFDITMEDVLQAVAGSNATSSGGVFNDRGSEYLIRGMGRVHDVEDIRSSVVATRNGVPVLIGAVATVRIGAAPRIGDASTNARPSVILTIQKQPHANTLDLTDNIERVVEDLRSQLPPGVSIDTKVFRQSDFINRAVDNVMGALRDGAILVVIVLLLFLGNYRITLLSILAIPLSLLITVIVFRFFNLAINTMTLGGMAIAIGALVDDAIIYVENVNRRLRLNARFPLKERRPIHAVINDASIEILSPMVHATFIIIIVFIPLFFLSGLEGRLLQPMGIAYVTSILASLLVAVTVTPVLASLLLPRTADRNSEDDSWLLKKLKLAYDRTLNYVLPRGRMVLIASGIMLLSALALFPFLGRSFLPEFNEGSLTITLITLPGTSLAQANDIGRQAEKKLLALPEVLSTARRTGRAELDEHAQGSNVSELDVRYEPGDRSRTEFLGAVRQVLTGLPGTNATIGQPLGHRIDHMLSGTRANIAVKLFGPDLSELSRLAERTRSRMEEIEGIVDLSIEQQMHVPQVTIRFKRAAMAKYGMMASTLADIIDVAFAGEVVSRFLEGDLGYDIVVRYDEGSRSDISALKEALIDTPLGVRVPLQQLADVRYAHGPHSISRENVQRKMVVQANIAGRDLRSIVTDIAAALNEEIDFPRGYHYELGGQFESEEAATRLIVLLSVLSIAAMFVLLYMEFRSLRNTVFIMANLPLALIGGVWAVLFMGGVLNVAALVGFITLFGIASRNGILMLSHYQRLLEEGNSIRETVLRGSMERLSPIMMTALTAALALIPLAIGMDEPGKEIEAPMAIVILGGLLTSTALNMIVIPTLFFRYGKSKTTDAIASED